MTLDNIVETTLKTVGIHFIDPQSSDKARQSYLQIVVTNVTEMWTTATSVPKRGCPLLVSVWGLWNNWLSVQSSPKNRETGNEIWFMLKIPNICFKYIPLLILFLCRQIFMFFKLVDPAKHLIFKKSCLFEWQSGGTQMGPLISEQTLKSGNVVIPKRYEWSAVGKCRLDLLM